MPIVRLLWALRSLPDRLGRNRRRTPTDVPFLDLLARRGVVLEERPGELVAGLAGEFWRLRRGEAPRFAEPADFAAFRQPEIAKAVIGFEWSGEHSVRLATTTRVHVAEAAARRGFARYWRVIRPFSGLTRIAFLRAVKRRAEQRAAGF